MDDDNIQRQMMRTINPSNRMGGFQIGEESNAVIKAREDLKTEIEQKGILQEAQKQLDFELKELNDELLDLEKEKFKLKLNRDSIGSQDSFPVHKKDTEIDSRATQYLRSDLYGESNEEQVRENVEK